MTSTIMEAAQFAAMAHAGQKRKYNDFPYITHPARVAGRTAILPGATEEMVMAAYLHDVIEDTKYTFEDLKEKFGDIVAEYVLELTGVSKDRYAGHNRAFRKEREIEYLRIVSPEAKKIKMLDRIDNLNEILGADKGFIRLYAAESKALVDAIGSADIELAIELETVRRRVLAL